jgi:protein TonB
MTPAPIEQIEQIGQEDALVAVDTFLSYLAQNALPPPADVAAPTAVVPIAAQLIAASRVEPRYPPLARRLGIGGTVVVVALIDAAGRVASAEVVEDPAPIHGLGRAAVAAVREWRYVPARLAGRPVESSVTVEIVFSPRR